MSAVRIESMESHLLLLGHRGARSQKSIPENSLAAFDLALASRCDGFEFDVRLAADGQAVLCHDAKIRGLEVSACSSKDLALPDLREVLIRYQNSAFLDIELKVTGLEAITARLLRQFPPARGFVVSSFLPEVLQEIDGLDRNIPLGLICEIQPQLNLWRQLPVEYVIPHFKLLNKKRIAEIRSSGKKILAWTVNAAASMKLFARLGVDGIISDDPRRLALTIGREVQSGVSKE
jgi:glycerophosphoryl diester phosphodiesterase